MDTRRDVFSLRTCCLITGASRGYGQCIAVRLAERLPPQSSLVLLARSLQGLQKTQSVITQRFPHVHVHIKAMDLAHARKADYEALLQELLTEKGLVRGDFEQSVVVHNAGSLGDVSVGMAEQSKEEALDSYWRFNLTSFTVINAVWHQFFRQAPLQQRLVIGVTSICALQPFKSWGIYCAGKAARDMLLHTYAEEEPGTLVLNYAPGPIDTDMQYEARTYTADRGLKDMFTDMKAGGKLLSPDQSVTRLLHLLTNNSFESGAHIDYYDIDCPDAPS